MKQITSCFPEFDAIPESWAQCPQWVLWRYAQREQRQIKLPLQPNGHAASVNNPAHWRTLPELAEDDWQQARAVNANGVGFVFTGEDPWVGIDFDRDNAEVREWVRIAADFGLYIERSVSWRGWHVIGRGQLPRNLNLSGKYGFEMYRTGRYFIVTGRMATGSIDADAQPLIDQLLVYYAPNAAPLPVLEDGLPDGQYDDNIATVERAREWLKHRPPAIEGQGGDNWTYKTACWLRDMGLSPARAVAVLLEPGGWNSRCQPPWNAEDLRRKVENAYRYAENGVGSRGVAAFDKLDAADEESDGSPNLDASPKKHDGDNKHNGHNGHASAIIDWGEQWEPVKLRTAATIPIKPVNWLWEGWLARGKIQILAGPPGTGKTTIAMTLAAAVTTGSSWPDGSNGCPPGEVVIWSGEDSPEDTLVPRLAMAGADLDKVHFITNAVDEEGRARPFDPATDIPLLVMQLQAMRAQGRQISLIVVDPIVSAVAGDSHKAAEVRRGLQPLYDLAEECGAAVLGVSHFAKGAQGRTPLERVGGSISFVALARIVIAVTKLPDSDTSAWSRLMCRVKSNLGMDDGGLLFDLAQHSLDADGYTIPVQRIEWGEYINEPAAALLERADGVTRQDRQNVATERDAIEFLLEALHDGPVNAEDLQKIARRVGFTSYMIRKAASKLGIRPKRKGVQGVRGGGEWVWELPAEFERIDDFEDAALTRQDDEEKLFDTRS